MTTPRKASRKKRIAAGAGVQVDAVNRLLKQHRQMADMMKMMGGKGGKGMMGKIGLDDGPAWAAAPCRSAEADRRHAESRSAPAARRPACRAPRRLALSICRRDFPGFGGGGLPKLPGLGGGFNPFGKKK